jgi:hypothetical protein
VFHKKSKNKVSPPIKPRQLFFFSLSNLVFFNTVIFLGDARGGGLKNVQTSTGKFSPLYNILHTISPLYGEGLMGNISKVNKRRDPPSTIVVLYSVFSLYSQSPNLRRPNPTPGSPPAFVI